MKKIFIIGCGFGGLSAARNFFEYRKISDISVTVFDCKKEFQFLPMLPDIIGRNINPAFISYPIKQLSKNLNFHFVNQKVTEVDLEKNIVSANNEKFEYDYLLISSGSETNFYNNKTIEQNVYKMDNCTDASIIYNDALTKKHDCCIVAGGSYTGIETATALRVLLNKNRYKTPIFIVEKNPVILAVLPEWIRDYVSLNLKRLNIEVITNAFIENINKEEVTLSNGTKFYNAMTIWTSGVKTPGYIGLLNVEKNSQGRLKVDEYLRINSNCFVAGDCAYFNYRNNFLRMAIQFAIAESECASVNIIRSIKNKELKKYKPIDFGYILPMANNLSCGEVFGLKVKGVFPTFFHFLMCLYRSYGLKNRLGIIKNLFSSFILRNEIFQREGLK